jgi:hypothetical protein
MGDILAPWQIGCGATGSRWTSDAGRIRLNAS